MIPILYVEMDPWCSQSYSHHNILHTKRTQESHKYGQKIITKIKENEYFQKYSSFGTLNKTEMLSLSLSPFFNDNGTVDVIFGVLC